MVSVAKHCLALTPNHPHNPFDVISTWGRDFLFNNLFIEALHTGRLALPGQFFERLPFGRTLDFIGINYYTRDFVRSTGLTLPGIVGLSGTLENERKIGKRNYLGWEVYRKGSAISCGCFAATAAVAHHRERSRGERRRTIGGGSLPHLWQGDAMRLSAGVPVVGDPLLVADRQRRVGGRL